MKHRAKVGSGRLGGAAVGFLSALAILLAALAPASASAGPAHYIYEVCDSALPGGNTPGAQFAVNPGVAFAGSNSCASPGGGLSITETGHVAGALSLWTVPISAPPGGFAENVTITGRSCALGPGNNHTFVFEQGWPSACTDTQRVFHAPGLSTFGISVVMNCDGNYQPGCEAGAGILAHYFAVQEVDPRPPTLKDLDGSLLAGGVVRGHHDLSVDASDEGGGLSTVKVLVNGTEAAPAERPSCSLVDVKNPSVVGTVAITPTPCPSTRHSAWAMDTESFPFHDGENSVQVCASDYASIADPNTTCSPAHQVTVDNSCSASTVPGGEVIEAHFAKSNGDQLTVPYGKSATVAGALTDAAGNAIRGATICVQMATQGAAGGLAPVATTRTDAQGHFDYRLASGPNRRVLFGYRHDRFEVARSLRYSAHARPTLRLSRRRVKGGGRIKIIGRLPGPHAGGHVVVEQASAPGSKRWYTFGRATTNARGVYRDRYRFDATTRSTTYRIRVTVPRQADYPYRAGNSKPARIKVLVGR